MSTIKITNLTFAYDGSHDNIYENASFQIDTDWKLGFIGRNGPRQDHPFPPDDESVRIPRNDFVACPVRPVPL